MWARYYAPSRARGAMGCAGRAQRAFLGVLGVRVGRLRNAHEAQAVAPDDDLVAVAQDLAFHPRAVDEHAVEAAVVEQAHAIWLAHDQRVPARDGRVIEAQIRGQAAPDARPLA